MLSTGDRLCPGFLTGMDGEKTWPMLPVCPEKVFIIFILRVFQPLLWPGMRLPHAETTSVLLKRTCRLACASL